MKSMNKVSSFLITKSHTPSLNSLSWVNVVNLLHIPQDIHFLTVPVQQARPNLGSISCKCIVTSISKHSSIIFFNKWIWTLILHCRIFVIFHILFHACTSWIYRYMTCTRKHIRFPIVRSLVTVYNTGKLKHQCVIWWVGLCFSFHWMTGLMLYSTKLQAVRVVFSCFDGWKLFCVLCRW